MTPNPARYVTAQYAELLGSDKPKPARSPRNPYANHSFNGPGYIRVTADALDSANAAHPAAINSGKVARIACSHAKRPCGVRMSVHGPVFMENQIASQSIPHGAKNAPKVLLDPTKTIGPLLGIARITVITLL
jgi:hypothetical protein